MKVITLRKIIEKLEKDYPCSFYDENGTMHLTDMQKELIIDVSLVTKELLEEKEATHE